MLKLKDLISEKISEDVNLFMLGNEAIARGVVEAGVSLATSYPGTPSSEVGDSLFSMSKKLNLKFQYSINEKVALETAFGSSISGLRSFVIMKHVGLNVASDPLLSISYTGVKAGMVIMTADDPSMFSSQNEQDNRNYADIAHIPLIEPSNPQEAKDFLIKAFEISEKYSLPVLFRTTTRVSHMRGIVKLGEIKNPIKSDGYFSKEDNFVALPSFSFNFKNLLINKISAISKDYDESELNILQENNEKKYGIITSGAAYNSVKDALTRNYFNADILKLGLTNPLKESLIVNFLNEHEEIIIVEELDPYLEYKIRTISQLNGISKKIYGKLDGLFSMSHEYSPDSVLEVFSKIVGFDLESPKERGIDVPKRPPILCPGCPHRGMYYAVKRAVKMMNLKDAIFSSDIGCYSLGVFKPYEISDTMISMGSSIGIANGLALSTKQKTIAFIGDSTFFHSGIPPLINAFHNKLNMLVIILDNRTTAMTGQQPNPGAKDGNTENPFDDVKIEEIVKSIGIKNLKIVDPYDLSETMKAVTSFLKNEEISVIIGRRECAILSDRRDRKAGISKSYSVNQDKCAKCMNCVENFACPAIFIDEEKVQINPILCDGCGICSEVYVCPFKAIEVTQ
jgi:indolepyruvate ferredoxin oxidoreductase alpha subunit